MVHLPSKNYYTHITLFDNNKTPALTEVLKLPAHSDTYTPKKYFKECDAGVLRVAASRSAGAILVGSCRLRPSSSHALHEFEYAGGDDAQHPENRKRIDENGTAVHVASSPRINYSKICLLSIKFLHTLFTISQKFSILTTITSVNPYSQ